MFLATVIKQVSIQIYTNGFDGKIGNSPFTKATKKNDKNLNEGYLFPIN